ncbi:YncE family protein [Paeniroseomonas aquatica]|uniref:YncE family protein n=1 Tax=Paeniroseomonas aquatica TaxID=373043 RepID=A0ABT8A9R2_9PROT|nr:YncE family protein [Paeniroseomonas aquatica]MDN3566373.1 YncE family protein [Paeniroseomonas aquatica]
MRHLSAATRVSRLGLSGLLLPWLVALGSALPGPARADIIYVLNSADASISLVDSTTREEVRRIPVLREVHHLLLTPDRSELVVGDSGANELIFIDPASGEVKRREKFSNPYHMEYSPDGRFLVVTSLRRDQVDIYDAATRTLLARLRVPDKPSHLAFSPDSRFAYVTLQGAKGLMAIDLAERKPTWTAEVGSQPAGVIWHRGRLLVGIMGSDHIAVVNPADGRVERTVFLGRGAHTIFPAPDGRALYVTSRVDSRISVLDPETLEVTARWDIPGGPDCIAFDPDGKMWVTLRWIARVAQVDPATGEAVTIPVGRSPHGVFVQPRRLPLPPAPEVMGPAAPPAVASRAIQPEDLPQPPATAPPVPTRAPPEVQASAPAALPPVVQAQPVSQPQPPPPLVPDAVRPVADRPAADALPWWRRWMPR